MTSSTPCFRFLPHGSSAPDALPPGEVWLDLGGRSAGRVFDHHPGAPGGSPPTSTAALVLDALPDLGQELPDNTALLTLVTHHSPDLDGIAAGWLVVHRRRLTTDGPDGAAAAAFAHRLVAAVTRRDQGYVVDRQPERDLGVVFQCLVIDQAKTDEARFRAGLAFLDGLEAAAGPAAMDLAAATASRVPPWLDHQLAKERKAHARDCARAPALTLALPTASQGEPQPARLRHFQSPGCSMTKVFARRQDPAAPDFWAAMAISTPTDARAPEGTPLWRHVISTDPASGLTLAGLGTALEAAEQGREDQGALPPLGGRERVAEGTGRFGGRVASPWYDGRGHGWTIVDSPAVTLPDGRRLIASRLAPGQVAAVIAATFPASR